jgi:hypothetical protein
MFRKTCLKIIIPAIVTFGCSAPEKIQQPVVIEKSHRISITGIVTSIISTNVDKSGKNPRFMLHFMVTIESYDDGGWNTVLGPEIRCVIRESDLVKQTGRKMEAGQRVLITTDIIEKSPAVIAVHTIEFL